MKRKTLRYILILAIVSVAGIISIQIYWFSRAFDIREKQFNQTVNIALRNVVDQILTYNGSPVHQINPIEQLSSNYFVVMVNDEIDANLLETLLINEFKAHGLEVDFEYGIYNCVNEKMVYGNSISLSNKSKSKRTPAEFAIWENNDYYFGVVFQNKQGMLLNQMGIWIFLSVVLFVVITFFAYAMFIILKQRKFSETQKQFINNMTHEFRTPISTIQLSSGVLQDPGILKTPDRLFSYVKIIKEESNRLLNQVENILQVSIIEDKKLRLKKEPLDVHEIIGEIVAGFNLVLQDSNIETQLDATRFIISADRINFTNMIRNLIDNGIKYSTSVPEVSVCTKDEKKGVLIEINDAGIGISKEHQKKIFNKFYRVSTGNLHDVKGFGLGLNFVKNMVKLHGGVIHLESRLGEGSSFKLIFPTVHED